MSDSRHPGQLPLRLSCALDSRRLRRRRSGDYGGRVCVVLVFAVLVVCCCFGVVNVSKCTAFSPALVRQPTPSTLRRWRLLLLRPDDHVNGWCQKRSPKRQQRQRQQPPLCVVCKALSTTADPLYNAESSVHNHDDDGDDWSTTTQPSQLAVHATSFPPPLPTPRIIPLVRGAAALSMSLPELASHLGGLGRAKLVWDMYRIGVDPLAQQQRDQQDLLLQSLLPSSRRTQRLGADALDRLASLYTDYNYSNGTSSRPDNRVDVLEPQPLAHSDGILLDVAQEQQRQQQQKQRPYGIEGGVATVSHVVQSTDGTTKLLLTLWDGTAVETVLIPNDHTRRTTVCVSSQVGCRQACTFCATGRMGNVRSLSADEILAQYYFALQTVRRSKHVVVLHNDTNIDDDNDNVDAVMWSGLQQELPPITNVGTFVRNTQCLNSSSNAHFGHVPYPV
jgi:hypothetical protein